MAALGCFAGGSAPVGRLGDAEVGGERGAGIVSVVKNMGKHRELIAILAVGVGLFGAITAHSAGIRSEPSALGSRIDEMNVRIDETNARIDVMSARMDAFSDSLAALRKEM